MTDRTHVADQLAARLQQLDDLRARLAAPDSPGELIVGGLRVGGRVRFPARASPRDRAEASVHLEDRADRQRQLAPPRDVRHVAERADHRDAGPLLGVRERVRPDRDASLEQRRDRLGAEQRLVARVVGVRHQRDARRQQLRARRVDVDRAAAGLREAHLVIGARHFAILELGLRHGGPEIHVPQRRGFELIGDAPLQQPQERALRHALRLPSTRSSRSSPSRPTARGTSTDPRRPSRLPPSAARTAR